MNTVDALGDSIMSLRTSFPYFFPEVALALGLIVIIVAGLITRDKLALSVVAAFVFGTALTLTVLDWSAYATSTLLFNNMLKSDQFSGYLKLIFDASGILTVCMSLRDVKQQKRTAEYYALLVAVVLGAHLLVMSINFIMVFISIELISLSSYVLAGFAFSRRGAEGSFKYFLFGSVASAIMLYGFTILYGLTGELSFVAPRFAEEVVGNKSSLLFFSALMALAGFLYKIGAAPLHPWAPDVYEAAPIPVIAFFSVVPKLAGIGVLTKFSIALSSMAHPLYDWQNTLALIAILSLIVGNFSALWQRDPKRLMAYSSIAQSGFLLVGISAFSAQGLHFLLFYATIYAAANFLVFVYLQYFDSRGFASLESFSGIGKTALVPSIFILIGLIALTGLPPTAGFTAKFFVFSSLWESYQLTGKTTLLWLLIFGLLNTVVSLFYYIRIPYYAFVKHGSGSAEANFLRFENLFGLLLVVVILFLFFNPGLLMGWINKINFVP